MSHAGDETAKRRQPIGVPKLLLQFRPPLLVKVESLAKTGDRGPDLIKLLDSGLLDAAFELNLHRAQIGLDYRDPSIKFAGHMPGSRCRRARDDKQHKQTRHIEPLISAAHAFQMVHDPDRSA